MKVTLFTRDGRKSETSSVRFVADSIRRGALRLIDSKDEAKVWYDPREITAIAIEPDDIKSKKPDAFLDEETENRLAALCERCAIRGKDESLCVS